MHLYTQDPYIAREYVVHKSNVFHVEVIASGTSADHKVAPEINENVSSLGYCHRSIVWSFLVAEPSGLASPVGRGIHNVDWSHGTS
ncbi:unnamed protein product [Penicillium roqueforti FM164]|uniref:Genomic scaffold, ProqFM164S03 n=1 Tax=Penicillium roqueforti (strain FM164) TaxID=1365484 RepID=W6QBR6_PENRF|nr:unnamed protein product [Penicillium roqueforti FM164]